MRFLTVGKIKSISLKDTHGRCKVVQRLSGTMDQTISWQGSVPSLILMVVVEFFCNQCRDQKNSQIIFVVISFYCEERES